jgi:hypothetical protein
VREDVTVQHERANAYFAAKSSAKWQRPILVTTLGGLVLSAFALWKIGDALLIDDKSRRCEQGDR